MFEEDDDNENHSWFGKRGATSQRWEYDVICKAWRKLAKKYPQLSPTERSRKLKALADKDAELSRGCFEYIAKNFEPLLRRLEGDYEVTPRIKTAKTAEDIIIEKKERAEEISEIKENIKQQHYSIIARTLHTFTFGQVAELAIKQPQLVKLAKMGKPKQNVSDVLTLAQVKKILK